MKRSASALWTLGLKNGKGSLMTQSGALNNAQYSVRTRHEEGAPGTNPEELIAAAHAACFSMALAGQLEAAARSPESIHTRATVTLEKIDDAFSIPSVHLEVVAKIPGTDLATLETIALLAKLECPVCRLLKAAVTLSVQIEA